MTANKRDFQAEFKDKVNALGLPDSLFEGSPITVDILCEAIEKYLPNIGITNEQFTLDTFKSILAKDFNLEKISKVLNFLVMQNAASLGMELAAFVQFQTDLRTVIKNYNEIMKPIIEQTEREAKLYESKMNPPGALNAKK